MILFICLSEIKCDEVDMKNVVGIFYKLGYTVIYSVRKHLSVSRSGGIMITVKHEMNNFWKPVRKRSEAFLSLHLNVLSRLKERCIDNLIIYSTM